jgi:DNA-binding CsgD family transcriptional regulator
MSLKLSHAHPIFTLKNRVQELTKNFLNSFGFNYFQYLRCFSDGSLSLLTNNTGLIEYFQQIDNAPVVFSSFTKEHENSHSYWFLWDEALPSSPVQFAREKYNLHNGITLVRRYKDYYDMIAVALPNEHANAASFYLNKLKAIEQFINRFDKENKDLLIHINDNKLYLPTSYRDINYSNLCFNNGRVRISGYFGITHITAQELTCLRLLFQGCSYKEIAKLTNLSPRTIETYINRVKQRTGFTSRFEIEQALLCP